MSSNSSFKIKPDKKIKVNRRSSITLDGKHKEIINEFRNNEVENIPNLKAEKVELIEKLKNVDNIDDRLNYQDRLNEVIEELRTLKSKKKNYYLNNSKYIFEYFENKKNISSSENTKIVTNKVNDFFKIKQEDDDEISKKDNENKNIVQKYLYNIDESFLDVNHYIFQSDICQFCCKGELIVVEDEGLMVCNSCFKGVSFLIESEKNSYKEPPKELCFYAYKKINHFKEILSQFGGKETTQIPDVLISDIKYQLKKERIGIDKLTHAKTKEILKKLGYNKYYEHITYIKNKLGIPPLTMPIELEETLCNLFNEIQTAFYKNVPDNRVNFLNYYYVLYKLCELLGETKYLEFIPLLRDRTKIVERDLLWGAMCKTLDWVYYPTV